jgi:hypothetical protein
MSYTCNDAYCTPGSTGSAIECGCANTGNSALNLYHTIYVKTSCCGIQTGPPTMGSSGTFIAPVWSDINTCGYFDKRPCTLHKYAGPPGYISGGCNSDDYCWSLNPENDYITRHIYKFCEKNHNFIIQ